jgi:rare lipoprotein A
VGGGAPRAALMVVAILVGCGTSKAPLDAGKPVSPGTSGKPSKAAVHPVNPANPAVKPDDVKSVQIGRASYYANKFNGRKTASGERYDPHKMTAAHKTLPFGTMVRVIRKGGPTVLVKVNDRCGCGSGRIIDLSRAAAKQLDMIKVGVVPVRLEILKK